MKKFTFRNTLIFTFVIFFITMFMSVGFSAISTELSIASYVTATRSNRLIDGGSYNDPGHSNRFLKCDNISDYSVTKLYINRNAPTEYTATCDVSAAQDGSIIAYLQSNGNVRIVSNNGIVYFNQHTNFGGMTNCSLINFNHLINTKFLVDAGNMFEHLCSNYSCSGISLDLSDFDTSNVTDMNRMFYQSEKITSIDLSSFNTSNVTNMAEMFYKVNLIQTLDLSSFNTSNVQTMTSMFAYTGQLNTIYVGSSWSTSSVTNANSAFVRADALPDSTNCPAGLKDNTITNQKPYLVAGKCLTLKTN